MSKPDDVQSWTPLADDAETPPLDLSTRLELSPHAKTARDEGALIANVQYGASRISLGADQREWMTRVIDGSAGRTVAEVARHAECADEDALELLQQLYQSGIMENAGDCPIPAPAFSMHARSVTLNFQVRLGDAYPYQGRRSKREVLGSLIEEYRFVIAAPEHTSAAVLTAPNERIRMMWSDYFADEYWHGIWLRRGLDAAGISAADLVSSDPLPSTQAVIRFLQWTALNNQAAYAVCLTAGESLGMTLEGQKRFYASLVEGGHVEEPVLAPFREHSLYDLEHEHNGLARELFADHGPLTRAQQDAVLRAMKMYHHLVFESRAQTVRYYADERNPIPFRVDHVPLTGSAGSATISGIAAA